MGEQQVRLGEWVDGGPGDEHRYIVEGLTIVTITGFDDWGCICTGGLGDALGVDEGECDSLEAARSYADKLIAEWERGIIETVQAHGRA